jgi:hypothetical protein
MRMARGVAVSERASQHPMYSRDLADAPETTNAPGEVALHGATAAYPATSAPALVLAAVLDPPIPRPNFWHSGTFNYSPTARLALTACFAPGPPWQLDH